MLERCACDPKARFVLTARGLLDMVVSRMAYHHWTCDDDAVDEATLIGASGGDIEIARASSSGGTGSSGAASPPPLPPAASAAAVRCGGQDAQCCWRRNAADMVQSWALCRDAYHLRVAELLALAGARDRLLLVSLSLEVAGTRAARRADAPC